MAVSAVLPLSSSLPVKECSRRQLVAKALRNQEMISTMETHRIRSEPLREQVRLSLRSKKHYRETLQLVDAIQRLGISHHFSEEINDTLQLKNDGEDDNGDDLFCTSLSFRLQRQHGHNVSPDVFLRFMDGRGNFKRELAGDPWAMLSLYEASHLGTEGEETMSAAMMFSASCLKKGVKESKGVLRTEIQHALEVPRHLRMPRLEARHCIEKGRNAGFWNRELLEFAALDFNAVQSLHQSEAAEVQRWWRELGLADSLPFARDRPLECYFWTLGIFWEPCYSNCRIHLAKAIALVLAVDDIFDIQGSMDELHRFALAVRRWDLAAMDGLPEYMKICYMALYNTTHEIGYSVLRNHGWNPALTHLERTWADVCEAMLVEAKWFSEGKVPCLEDYLENGVTTAGVYMALVHAFFLVGEQLGEGGVRLMEPYPKVFSCAGRILRLWDDLGTASEEVERGDAASCLQCCMQQGGISGEEEARRYSRMLIEQTWKELNRELFAPTPLPSSSMRASLNMARTARVIYQHGDDPASPTVDEIISLLLRVPV